MYVFKYRLYCLKQDGFTERVAADNTLHNSCDKFHGIPVEAQMMRAEDLMRKLHEA